MNHSPARVGLLLLVGMALGLGWNWHHGRQSAAIYLQKTTPILSELASMDQASTDFRERWAATAGHVQAWRLSLSPEELTYATTKDILNAANWIDMASRSAATDNGGVSCWTHAQRCISLAREHLPSR